LMTALTTATTNSKHSWPSISSLLKTCKS